MEIILVIAVISILLTITIKFGSGHINDLKHQSSKEMFVNSYNKLYSQTLTSNYHEGTRYDQLQIALNLSGGIGTNFIQGDTGYISPFYESSQIELQNLLLDSGTVNNNVVLSFKPYILGCSLMGITTNGNEGDMFTGSLLTFTLLVDHTKSYCFSIQSDTCKLIEHTCLNEQ